jgi:pimeloyl-ACP methyl ester carboxylesterase
METKNYVSPRGQAKLVQDGYSVHYFAHGDRKNECIVFFHPAFADHRCFDDQVSDFSKNYRVVTFDIMGHGLSKIEKTKDKIDKTADHVYQILQEEEKEKAHLVGSSMGGLLAQHFALKYPGKVESLTVSGAYDICRDNREIARAQRGQQVKWMAKALFFMNAFRKTVAREGAISPRGQARLYDMAKCFSRKSFTVMPGLHKVVKERHMPTRPYPLLILHGEKDIELARRAAEGWHKTEKRSRFEIIKHAGHNANMDNPKDFNNIVSEFIARKQ